MPRPRPSSPSPDNHLPSPSEFQELLRKAKAGDPIACQQFHDRFYKYARKVVRRLLNPRLRTVLDSGDLTQEVWFAFFAGLCNGSEFAGPEQFRAFLAQVAEKKTLQSNRNYLERQKRSRSREEPLGRQGNELPDRSAAGQDPAEQASSKDDEESVLASLSPRKRSAVEALRAGESLEAAARHGRMSVRSLRRIAETPDCGC